MSKLKHILIADDDNDDVFMFESAVQETCPGVEVSSVPNGLSLLKSLDEISVPDVIVLDLNMPVKGGKECLLEIRSQDRFKTTPIFILSTSNSKADIDFCLSRGATGYFTKPVTYSGLKSIAEKICLRNYAQDLLPN